MKLLVISDTHGRLERGFALLTHLQKDLHGVIHLGDYDQDGELLQKAFPRLAFYVVRGNNDYSTLPYDKILRLEGKTLALTHGHKKRAQTQLDTLQYWGEEAGADMVLFGHTHRPFVDMTGRMGLLNPGSLCLPRGPEGSTFATLELDRNKPIKAQLWKYKNEGLSELL